MGALGRRNLGLQPIETVDWAHDTVRQFRRQNDARTATLSVRGDIPRITADSEKLTRALTNVLSSAFKYSDESQDASVKLSADGESVHMCVTEHGIGMTAEDIARLCDSFYREDAAKDIQGTGLGMSWSWKFERPPGAFGCAKQAWQWHPCHHHHPTSCACMTSAEFDAIG